MLIRGARSGRAVIGGTGLEPIIHMAGRGNHHRAMLGEPGSVEPGSAAERTDAYLDRIGADRVALRRVLDTFVDTPVEALGEVEVPVLLLFGEQEDKTRGSVEDLAAALPRATIRRVPGDHITAPRSPPSPTRWSSSWTRVPRVASASAFEAHEVDLHGHQSVYREAGSGPNLVLIHGMINSSRHWRGVAERLPTPTG